MRELACEFAKASAQLSLRPTPSASTSRKLRPPPFSELYFPSNRKFVCCKVTKLSIPASSSLLFLQPPPPPPLPASTSNNKKLSPSPASSSWTPTRRR